MNAAEWQEYERTNARAHADYFGDPWQEETADERAFMPGYDRHGQPNSRYIPGHRHAQQDDTCGRIRDALLLTARGVADLGVIERETEMTEIQITRMRRRLGLLAKQDGDAYYLVEEWDGALDRARELSVILDEADDVTLACLRLKLALLRGTKSDNWVDRQVPRVSADHPAALVWLAEQSDEHSLVAA